MNEDSRDGIVGNALKLVGFGTAVSFAHKGINSKKLDRFADDPDSLRGGAIRIYRKVNPIVDRIKNGVKAVFDKNPTLDNTPDNQNPTPNNNSSKRPKNIKRGTRINKVANKIIR